MTTLIAGASGATGRLLVDQLLQRGHDVRIIVRNPGKMPESILNNEKVTVIEGSILDFDDSELEQYVYGCNSVASCLGHNVSFKGMYGKPRRLVTDAVRRLCRAVEANKSEQPVKFILMNSSGVSNRDVTEKLSFAHKCVIWLLRLLLPPHVDNEKAAEVLRTEIGQDNTYIEWVAVRPDGLTDADNVTEYELHPSPIKSAIFEAGKISRINVGAFMAELASDQNIWKRWKGQMPVIYSKTV